MTTLERFLIVNADDLGQSPAINRGIFEAHRRGIVTSASLMVRWPWAREAARAASQCPSLSLGLHLDFGEWAFRDGSWTPRYEVVPLDDEDAVHRELEAQLERFEAMVGRGPTHLDSHQHVHTRAPLRDLALDEALRRNIPLRHHGSVRHCGAFYGQTAEGAPAHDGVTVESLMKIIEGLPEGTTELSCHPASGEDLPTMYGSERMQELSTLCDRRVRDCLRKARVRLVSFDHRNVNSRAEEGAP